HDLPRPNLGALRACHCIGFTEALVPHHPSTDRLRRNAKVASGVLHQSAAGNQLADVLAEFRRELRWAMRGTFRLSRGLCLWVDGVRHGQSVRELTEQLEPFPMSGPVAAARCARICALSIYAASRARARGV